MAATSQIEGNIVQFNYEKYVWEFKTYLGSYLKVNGVWLRMEIKDGIQLIAIGGVIAGLIISATVGFKDSTTGIMCISGFLTILGVTKLSSSSESA